MTRAVVPSVARVASALLTAAVAACADPSAPRPLQPEVDAPLLAIQRTDAVAPNAPATGATVFVVHGINGRDLSLPEALPVDVEVNGACAIQQLPFRAIRGPIPLPAGQYDIAVRLAAATPCSGAAVITVNGATLRDGDNVSIVAHLSAAGTPTASIFANDLSGSRQSSIAARHAAAFGAVDIAAGETRIFTGVTNGQGGTADVSAGQVRVSIFPAGGRPAAFRARVAIPAGEQLILYAVGTPSKGTFEVIAQQLRLTRTTVARVSVLHGINGRDLGLAESLPVDVSLNGQCALPGFTFRTITPPLALPAGRYDIVVRLAGSSPCTGTPVITANGVWFDANGFYSVIAHLSAGGAPTASVFADRLAGDASVATVAARHTAAFGAVDILVNGGVAFAGVTNGTQGRAALPPGTVQVGIAPAGSGTPVLTASPTVVGGRVVNAFYAVGTPANGTFEVLAQAVQRP